MASAARFAWVFVLAVCACGAPQRPPPVAHTGWTLRYTERVGQGASAPRDVQPDVAMTVLDGVARIDVADHRSTVRLDRVHHSATVRGAAASYATGLAASTATQGSAAVVPLAESEATLTPLDEGTEVAGVPTHGARFEGTVRTSAGTVRIGVEARWIESPGDPAVEVVKDWFVAPLERLGARRVVESIRTHAGLPLQWEVRLVNTRPDGTTVEGAVAILAAELGNAPETTP